MVAMFCFFVLPVNSAGTTRPTSRFRLRVITAVNLFSLAAPRKLSTKVKHSIGTWFFFGFMLQCHDCHTWKHLHNCLYVNLIFHLFPASTQIYEHVRECVWKKLFYRTSKTLQAKFVAFSLPLFIQVTKLTLTGF